MPDQTAQNLLVEKKNFTFAEPPEEMVLDSGARLGPITLAYETLGTLNAARSNVVLILHACSGDAHVAGRYRGEDQRPGWWETMVGPGRPVDTNRYFVICSNILGSCMGSTGPSSLNPKTGKPYGCDFPLVTIKDMVRAQKHLLDHLGISKIMSMLGGSVGGMQVLRWCVDYPEMVVSAIPIATTPRHSAQAIAFNEVARQAIMSDPDWRGGNYYDGPGPDHGLAVARMIGHVTYLSDESMRDKFGRKLQDRASLSYDFNGDFAVESYLRHQGAKFVARFDANSLLYITKAADYFDLERGGGSLLVNEDLAQIRFLVLSFTSDWLYPTYQARAIVSALKKNGSDVSFCEIDTRWGHDAFLMPSEQMDKLIAGFLDRISHECEQ